MKKTRQMPKKGYYRYKEPAEDGDVNIIYTTGIPGKGGHMYYRIMMGKEWGWCTLLWTCVPGIKDMNENYEYSETCPDGIPKKPDVIIHKQK